MHAGEFEFSDFSDWFKYSVAGLIAAVIRHAAIFAMYMIVAVPVSWTFPTRSDFTFVLPPFMCSREYAELDRLVNNPLWQFIFTRPVIARPMLFYMNFIIVGYYFYIIHTALIMFRKWYIEPELEAWMRRTE